MNDLLFLQPPSLQGVQHPDCVDRLLVFCLKPIILNKQPNWKDLLGCVCMHDQI